MKTLFAQTATFALSAVGALAILVGVIDHPQVVYDAVSYTHLDVYKRQVFRYAQTFSSLPFACRRGVRW